MKRFGSARGLRFRGAVIGSRHWPLLAPATAASAVVLALVSAGLAHRAGVELNRAERAAAESELQAQSVPAPTKSEPAPGDFTTRLGLSADADLVIQRLQRSSTELGLVLLALSTKTAVPTAQSLGRVELAFSVRGAYPQIKTLLGDLAGSAPNIVVQRLSLHRQATPTDVEAQVDVTLLTRPLMPPGN